MEKWRRCMEIKYKKLIFNPNAYFDIKRKEVILPISPEWKNVVKWQKEFPNIHKRILYVADEIQRQQQEAAAAEAAAQQVEQKEAPNQKKIGERKQDQVKIQGEKKKAPTKGSV